MHMGSAGFENAYYRCCNPDYEILASQTVKHTKLSVQVQPVRLFPLFGQVLHVRIQMLVVRRPPQYGLTAGAPPTVLTRFFVSGGGSCLVAVLDGMMVYG